MNKELITIITLLNQHALKHSKLCDELYDLIGLMDGKPKTRCIGVDCAYCPLNHWNLGNNNSPKLKYLKNLFKLME